MNVEKIKERQKLRREILEKLYELLHSGGPEWPSKNKVQGVIGTKKELYIDNAHHKAYHYLHAKEFILISSLTPNADKAENERLGILITAKGIDFIESLILNENEAVVDYP